MMCIRAAYPCASLFSTALLYGTERVVVNKGEMDCKKDEQMKNLLVFVMFGVVEAEIIPQKLPQKQACRP